MRLRDAEPEVADSEQDAQDRDLIIERLAWTPAERLRHLLEMLAFEQRAHAARSRGPLTPKPGTEPDR
jgi:hypothetical protein